MDRYQRGVVFNMQRYSIHDGPGIRTNVFLKGCPLRCWWCHNPESQSAASELRVMEHRCMQCGECVAVCPQSEEQETGAPQPPPAACTRCGACVAVCPTGARQIVGQTMGVDEVLAEVLRDRIFYDDSGGGVTFSGGEPLLQAEFLCSLLEACRSERLHSVVDTCGCAPRETLLQVAALTNLFLYDLKIIDDNLHREGTGVSNAEILGNLEVLGQSGARIWIRVPIVPGWNDSDEQLTATARFAASVPGVEQVQLLPYHELGRHKVRGAAAVEGHPSQPPPSPEQLERAADRFRACGLSTRIGG